MTEKAWKATERQIAAALGGERVPITGRQRGSAPDVRHDWLAIEVKHRRRIPAWLLEAMAQARASAGASQLPIAVVHEHGHRFSEALVVLRLEDFREWFGETSIAVKEIET